MSENNHFGDTALGYVLAIALVVFLFNGEPSGIELVKELVISMTRTCPPTQEDKP